MSVGYFDPRLPFNGVGSDQAGSLIYRTTVVPVTNSWRISGNTAISSGVLNMASAVIQVGGADNHAIGVLTGSLESGHEIDLQVCYAGNLRVAALINNGQCKLVWDRFQDHVNTGASLVVDQTAIAGKVISCQYNPATGLVTGTYDGITIPSMQLTPVEQGYANACIAFGVAAYSATAGFDSLSCTRNSDGLTLASDSFNRPDTTFSQGLGRADVGGLWSYPNG